MYIFRLYSLTSLFICGLHLSFGGFKHDSNPCVLDPRFPFKILMSCSFLRKMKKPKRKRKETRPDTRQFSRGRFGRSSNAKKQSQFRNVTDGSADTARCRVACPRLKRIMKFSHILCQITNLKFLDCLR